MKLVIRSTQANTPYFNETINLTFYFSSSMKAQRALSCLIELRIAHGHFYLSNASSWKTALALRILHAQTVETLETISLSRIFSCQTLEFESHLPHQSWRLSPMSYQSQRLSPMSYQSWRLSPMSINLDQEHTVGFTRCYPLGTCSVIF